MRVTYDTNVQEGSDMVNAMTPARMRWGPPGISFVTPELKFRTGSLWLQS